jgi:hypothetical protein
MRRHIASVRERVHPRLLGREAQQRAEVVEVRVDAAPGDEPEQMHLPPALEGRTERLVLEEGAVGDRLVDPHQVLVEASAGADRQVPDLGVAHLARRQPDRLPRGGERRVWIAPPQVVEDRGRGQRDRVSRARRRAAPPVEHDERYERVATAA